MFVALRRESTKPLTGPLEHFRLRDILRYNLKTRPRLSSQGSVSAGLGLKLGEWCRRAMRSRIEPMKKIARSLRQSPELIPQLFSGGRAGFKEWSKA
jgi:hypothetical protein